MNLIWINLWVTSNMVVSEKVATYFLNSNYTFRDHFPNNPNIDCVHTDDQNVILLTQSITVCYRSLPFLYTGNNGFYLATSISFDNQFKQFENGFVLGVWDSAYF